MIRQNRAVPILMVLTIAWVLYLGGCFGSEQEQTSVENEPVPTPLPTSTPEPVVTESSGSLVSSEEPFVYTIEEGETLPSIATKFNVTQDVIVRANPDLNPNVIFAGDQIRIPGASTINTIDEDRAAARDAGDSIDYVIEEGDNLGALAQTWTVTIDAILEANPGVDPNTLQIGQLIVIPPFGTGIPPEELEALRAPTCAERQPGEVLFHIVEPGDSASALAAFYGVTIDELIGANALADENQLVVGQELAIPPPSQDSSC